MVAAESIRTFFSSSWPSSPRHSERPARDQSLCPVCAPKEFRQAIQREEALVDRNEHPVSLVVFQPYRGLRGTRTARLLVEVLSQRVRRTDVMGRLDGRRIGVLQPYTDRNGAVKVADEVCDLIKKAIGGQVSCDVYTYPGGAGKGSRSPGHAVQLNLFGGGLSEAGRTQAVDSPREAGAPVVPSDGASSSVAFQGRLEAVVGGGYPAWKRAVDVVISISALLILSPVMLVVAALIRKVSPGPIFFKQERVGYLGRPFLCYKFRTMHVAASQKVHEDHVTRLMENEQPMEKLDLSDDSRLIPTGKVLRASGLDELPQLLNVLKGQMSLVGPRPCVPYEFEKYLRWHQKRCATPPGLTGVWQVNGKNETSFTEMMRLDVGYTQRPTLRQDLAIIFARTIPAIVSQVRRVRSASAALAAPPDGSDGSADPQRD